MDKFNLYDSLDVLLGNDALPSPHARTLKSEITVYKLRNGKPTIEIGRETNDIVIGGAIQVLQAMFGVDAPVNAPTLNSILGVPNVENVNSPYQIRGFMVGVGGSGLLPGSIKSVEYNSTSTLEPIPFRKTLTRLAPNLGYCLCKEADDGTFEYYGKKFATPQMQVRFLNGADIDEGYFTLQNPPNVVSYVEMLLDITLEDLGEYFASQNNPVIQINSLGLIMGRENPLNGELSDARLATLFNTKSYEFDQFEEGMRFRYRVFAV